MGFFKRIMNSIKRVFTRKKRQDEWADRFNQPPAQPTNPTPLDPSNDPWRT